MKRRDFLKTFAGMAALTVVPRHVLGGVGYTAPSDQLTKGIIGVGSMGRGHYGYAGTRLVAICDVDKNHLKAGAELAGEKIATYSDYRKLIADPNVDIVHIATPPHWHGIMAADAAKAGKDIWCEKPMTRTIGEGKRVMEAVRRNGNVFRLNTWFRFADTFYGMNTTVDKIKKLVDSGMLGWPLKVTISKHTGFNWKFFWVGNEKLEEQKVPAELDYDMWLGPAPYKPSRPRDVPGLLGLRCRRTGRHGAALHRPGAVSSGQRRHEPRFGRNRRSGAASRCRGNVAENRIHLCRRL